MKELLELIPFLNGYPVWVRGVMFGIVPVYMFVFVMLFVFAPPPVVFIETLRRVTAIGKKSIIALDVIVRNPTASIATISAAELELYSGKKPQGGLMSSMKVSATYTVEKSEEAAIVQSDKDELPFETTVTRPYAGTTYERMTLPLTQEIEAGKVDRFIILLRGENIILPENDIIELQLIYNGNERTAPADLSIY